MRLNWKNTLIIGLGFFGIALVWPIYNSYMPLMYASFSLSKTTIGYLMTIDNWLVLTLTPLIGYLSDKTRTRYGRRMPYLLIGGPVAALFLFLIPFGWASNLWLLFTFVVGLNLALAAFRSPVIALMPDVTPVPLRSKANGIINFMGGLAYIAATLGGSMLYRINPGYPFYATACLLAAVVIACFLWIREPEGATEQSERLELGMVRDRSTVLLLLAIFFWFIGYNGVETWLTTYGTEHLHQEADKVARLLTYSGAAFLLMAVPAGFVADGAFRWRGLGRKWTIMAGLLGMASGFFLLGGYADLSAGWMPLLLVGFSWAWVNTNAYPMITQMAGAGQIGAYTGLYYLSAAAANIASPPLFGWVFDRFGYQYFFPMATGFILLAMACMIAVRRGDTGSGLSETVAD